MGVIKRWIGLPFTVVCLLAGLVAHAQSPLVTLRVVAEAAETGQAVRIRVLMDCQVDACAAAHFTLQFNPAALRVETISPGDFPGSTGNTTYLIRSDIDHHAGSLTASYVTVSNNRLPVTGTGVVIEMTVIAFQAGEFDLTFTEASVASLDGQTVLIPQTVSGRLAVMPDHTPQRLMIQAESGSPAQISVNASSNDRVASETIAGEALVVEIVSDGSPDSFIELDAPGHLACSIRDNENAGIMLYAGDLNDDGSIDVQDAVMVGLARPEGSQNEIDVNGDRMVNIYELIHIGRNYGMRSGDC